MLLRSLPDLQFVDVLLPIIGNDHIQSFLFRNLHLLEIKAVAVDDRFEKGQIKKPPVSFHKSRVFRAVLFYVFIYELPDFEIQGDIVIDPFSVDKIMNMKRFFYLC